MLNQDKNKQPTPASVDSRIIAAREKPQKKKGFAASFLLTVANEADSRKKNFSFLRGFGNKVWYTLQVHMWRLQCCISLCWV